MERYGKGAVLRMGAVGTNTTAIPSEKPYPDKPDNATAGASSSGIDLELLELAQLWAHLPASVRASLLNLARATKPNKPR